MKIVWASDFDFKSSGYFNISTALCVGLANKGHEIKAVGLGYKGEEHNFPFGIIPTNNLQELVAIVHNMKNMWGFDVLIVALDIPLQERIMMSFKDKDFPIVAIFPLEASPLVFSSAIQLSRIDRLYCISEFGTNVIRESGLPVEYLPVGIDTNSWVLPTQEEREAIRKKALGITDDKFVVLTVADNQERKNLVAGMEAFKRMTQEYPNAVYHFITREHNPVGWKLRDYANELGIADKIMIFERGMSFQQLWSMYAASDLFVLPSKAEGLGMPLREAQAVGIPCIGTDCTGIHEQLCDGRGILIPHEYMHRDPFGNGERFWINKELLAQAMLDVATDRIDLEPIVKKARAWVETLNWDTSVELLEKGIEEYGKKIPEPNED